MKARIARLLTSRWLPFLLPVVAIAIVLPSLWTGWQQDDLVQRYSFLGFPKPAGMATSPLYQFRFLDGDSAYALLLMDEGVMPWWTLPALRLSFWRPLSSVTHCLDYLLWPGSAELMHAQSLVWFGAFILVAALFYRRMLGLTLAAGLAALFFALEDGHGLAAGWIANRNALISGVFGILTLIAHDRWRRDHWRPGGILAPLSLLLGLLGGELAMAICAYLLAYALFIDRGTPRARALSLLPHAVVAVAWLTTYTLLGFGTWGSGFYVDPASEPLKFLAAVAWKGPLLLADQLFLPPSSPVLFFPQLVPVALIWAVAILVLIGILMFPLLRRERRTRFWAAGMILSIPLICTTMPHGRLLIFTGIGGFGLLAEWIAGVTEGAGWLPTRKVWKNVAHVMLVAFLVVHLAFAAPLLTMNSTSAAFAQRYIQDAALGLRAGPELNTQNLVIVNHPIIFYAHQSMTPRILAGEPAPRRLRVLAPGSVAIKVARPDEKTLVVCPEGGFLAGPFDNVFRDPSHPLKVGDCVQLTGFSVEITGVTDDARPAEAVFHFSVPLEDPSLRWIRWEGKGYVPFEIPPVGETVSLPAAPPLF